MKSNLGGIRESGAVAILMDCLRVEGVERRRRRYRGNDSPETARGRVPRICGFGPTRRTGEFPIRTENLKPEI